MDRHAQASRLMVSCELTGPPGICTASVHGPARAAVPAGSVAGGRRVRAGSRGAAERGAGSLGGAGRFQGLAQGAVQRHPKLLPRQVPVLAKRTSRIHVSSTWCEASLSAEAVLSFSAADWCFAAGTVAWSADTSCHMPTNTKLSSIHHEHRCRCKGGRLRNPLRLSDECLVTGCFGKAGSR